MIGDIYYVGTAGMSSYLITTPGGHFLIDGALPQSAPQIRANIAALGFDIRAVKCLLNRHAHYDHAGGLASLQRASGAAFVASAADRAPLEAGHIAYGPTVSAAFQPIRVDRVIADGEGLTLGGVTLTAVMTPGHTEGCTCWTMQATGADGAPHRAFLHCSATVGGNALDPEAHHGIVANYRRSFARVREIHVDVFLANHAGAPNRRRRQRLCRSAGTCGLQCGTRKGVRRGIGEAAGGGPLEVGDLAAAALLLRVDRASARTSAAGRR